MSLLEQYDLKPANVFRYFEEIAAIPHGSRNTKAISDYLVAFAKAHDLEYYQDELNNVVIIKEATEGYDGADPIIIQGHMDMVCEKEKDCEIDFEKDGLDLYVDGDFLKARGTTLGGDDGIAVAYALAILEADDLCHPRLEVVITVDEEIGMLGAEGIDLSMLKGHKMLNIDSDVEGHFLTSCAGGMHIETRIPVDFEEAEGVLYTISVTGLEGGHSGAEIDKEHGNANIIMGRVLKALADEIGSSVMMPKNGRETEEVVRGLAEVRECLQLERTRIEAGLGDLETIKENFESQCLQRCLNIKADLERLPKLSKIMLDGEQIPMISLQIPYVKEEFFGERMTAYIDEVIQAVDKIGNPAERMKYIRMALSYKKLFSVIVSDMNGIKLLLYKRERIKEQSRHLRYEEAVGSTGQSQGIYIQFLIAVINYISSIYSPKGDAAGLRKVIFIDNPFGAAKDVYIWEPIFELLRANHVQLIVPARGTTPAITGRFDVNYVLGQKLIDGRQQTVVVDYCSHVEADSVEFIPLQFEQTSLDISEV